MTTRFRFHRAGVLNVWQYDDQVFDFADGRLLLRGANGAGKSKTMEMLLPFVLDGDQSRLTASGRHHTSLVWLLLDGYDAGARTGYLWVEFLREGPDGEPEALTCGVGLRATASARQATTWFFTTPRRVGIDLALETDTGPLSQAALTALLTADEGRSQVFDNGRRYREHVGAHLFGLPPDQYESLLRLIYWLRRPQVGEDIDPKKLAAQLVNALPFVDPDTLAAAGTTFDDLQAHGEEIDRQAQAAQALARFVETYAAYARSVVASRGSAAESAAKEVHNARRQLRRVEGELEAAIAELDATESALTEAASRGAEAAARITALEASPEARSRATLAELHKAVSALATAARDRRDDADRAQRRAQSSAQSAQEATGRLERALARMRSVTAEARDRLTQAGASPDPVPAGLALLAIDGWEGLADLDAPGRDVESVLVAHADWIALSRNRIGQRLAAVTLVGEALTASQSARANAERAQGIASDQEARTERARRAADDAAAASRVAEAGYAEAYAGWRGEPVGQALVLPELTELTAEALDALPGIVERAVAPERQARASAVATARFQRDEATAAIAALEARRREVAAEVDPTPAPPGWRRTPRTELSGAPLWRVVDFRPELDARARAGLEAALDAAGLLDAWLTPTGELLGSERLDLSLLAPSTPRDRDDSARPSLQELLVADPPADGGVSTAAIESVLAGIALVDDRLETDAAVAVGITGEWVVGPAHGRTTKESAQYIGATARQEERRRRIAALDGEIAAQVDARDRAAGELADAEAAAEQLAAWVVARPRHSSVLTAWTRESTLTEARSRAESELETLLGAARTAREQASARHTELVRLGEVHALPTTSDGLLARRELLTAAQEQLRSGEDRARDLHRAHRDWHGQVVRARADRDDAVQADARRAAAERDERRERARHDELAAAAGAGIVELEERLQEQRSRQVEAEADKERHGARQLDLVGRIGALNSDAATRREALAAAEPRREEAYDAFAALHTVPGLVIASGVLGSDVATDGSAADDAVPAAEPTEVRRMTERAAAGTHASPNDLQQALNVVQSGPASIVEPRIVDVGGAWAAIGRGEGGDESLPELADKLAAKVEADRALLSDRERELFETHVLGQLGDALRGVRRQADELVTAMNQQLQTVTTSQGIRVRLRWRRRDDIPADAKRAIDLLGNPSGALLAEERADLRNALHRLIDVSRSEAPEDSYTEHLARALDYREWYAFTVQYQRPEEGQWRDLQARSALSQGEQKVLCYLPLFAAAAAHFTSLAGAAPHAPRFVLLDDAFPKIDARTHPLLFGLLVQLDLDFVVTSERLWGTHPTVPSLAIYEALRNPAQRGIAQFEHRWDGHQLTAVGAHA